MNTPSLPEKLRREIASADHPAEFAVDVMFALQRHYGYLSDEALIQGAELLRMTPLELEELATFYDFLYREPVGRYVIHVCNNVVCWMHGHESVMGYISAKLRISLGGTTEDGMFTLLPASCIGFCDAPPAMLINGKPYGHLTAEKIDTILEQLREKKPPLVEVR